MTIAVGIISSWSPPCWRCCCDRACCGKIPNPGAVCVFPRTIPFILLLLDTLGVIRFWKASNIEFGCIGALWPPILANAWGFDCITSAQVFLFWFALLSVILIKRDLAFGLPPSFPPAKAKGSCCKKAGGPAAVVWAKFDGKDALFNEVMPAWKALLSIFGKGCASEVFDVVVVAAEDSSELENGGEAAGLGGWTGAVKRWDRFCSVRIVCFSTSTTLRRSSACESCKMAQSRVYGDSQFAAAGLYRSQDYLDHSNEDLLLLSWLAGLRGASTDSSSFHLWSRRPS